MGRFKDLRDRFYYWWTFTKGPEGYVKYKNRNNKFDAGLGADIVIAPNDDGVYICNCGRKLHSAYELYTHRRFDHKA